MAIIGKPEDVLKQNNLSNRIEKGLTFLLETNLHEIFIQMENGGSNVVEIDGKNLFAVFSSYETKVNIPPIFEGHRKYIDIQYIIKGEELIFVTSNAGLNLGDYDNQNDCQLCQSELFSSFLLTPGTVSILYPEDWHASGQQSIQPEKILKIVVKAAITGKD
ncbi:MAG: YhcH/YjgK/YiaL family protein [Bacteroidetes bacterium]|nr:YhcH/YjgK/YiaL family protein [Bacteroidota bacterium]